MCDVVVVVYVCCENRFEIIVWSMFIGCAYTQLCSKQIKSCHIDADRIVFVEYLQTNEFIVASHFEY